MLYYFIFTIIYFFYIYLFFYFFHLFFFFFEGLFLSRCYTRLALTLEQSEGVADPHSSSHLPGEGNSCQTYGLGHCPYLRHNLYPIGCNSWLKEWGWPWASYPHYKNTLLRREGNSTGWTHCLRSFLVKPTPIKYSSAKYRHSFIHHNRLYSNF